MKRGNIFDLLKNECKNIEGVLVNYEVLLSNILDRFYWFIL